MINKEMLEQGLNSHLIWKMRFTTAIDERSNLDISSKILSMDNQCPFGKWIHGELLTTEEKNSVEWETVVAFHKRFHIIAGDIKQLIDENNMNLARMLMRTTFEQLSKELIHALEHWIVKLPKEKFKSDVSTICNSTAHSKISNKKNLQDLTQACLPTSEKYRKRFN